MSVLGKCINCALYLALNCAPTMAANMCVRQVYKFMPQVAVIKFCLHYFTLWQLVVAFKVNLMAFC